jgi:hypothetical protein
MDADIIRVIIVVVVMIAAGIVQLLNKVNEQAQGKAPQRPRPGQPGPKGLEDEIGEFLRRAAQQRRGQAPPTPELAPARRSESIVQAEVVAASGGAEVGEHVRKHLDTTDFNRRESHLADEVTQADEKMDEHLRGVFDHRLGQFAQSPSDTGGVASAESAAMGAAAIVALLATPQSVRQAIIINEILQRPEQRWT